MLNFGVMMILRPIGDFFGFFLRPIFIMLLRKFIIPFYQTYLPMMQQMGADMGERVVKLLMLILDFWTDPMKDEGVTGNASLPTAESQAAQLAAQKAALAAGVTDQDALVKILQQVEKDVDPDNEKFQIDTDFDRTHNVNPTEEIDTTAGFDPSGLASGATTLTPEQIAMLDEYGVNLENIGVEVEGAADALETASTAMDGITSDLDNATENIPIITNQNLIPDPEPEMTAQDMQNWTQESRKHTTTQNINIIVEGNLDTEAAKQMEDKMHEIAKEEDEIISSSGRPRYASGSYP